jgi:betaine-homocysteine S-methyltransferase
VDDINRAAVQIARQVAAEGDALVAGNISLTWAYDPNDPKSPDRVRALFDRQIEVMLDSGGVDFIIGETYSWLGEALIAVERIKQAGLPAMVTMSFEKEARAYEGDSPAECARKLADAGADIVGVNCLRGPEHTLPILKEMREAVSGYVAAQPAAYHTTDAHPDFTSLPEFPLALDPLQLPRAAMADFAIQARAMGVDYIGSCCGSVAAHVRAMAQALGKRPVEEREWKSKTGKPMSAYEYYEVKREA